MLNQLSPTFMLVLPMLLVFDQELVGLVCFGHSQGAGGFKHKGRFVLLACFSVSDLCIRHCMCCITYGATQSLLSLQDSYGLAASVRPWPAESELQTPCSLSLMCLLTRLR